MSGASLAGVARAAASRALERAVTDFAGHVAEESTMSSSIMEKETHDGNSISDCLVTQKDFEKAIEDVFGGDYSEKDNSLFPKDPDEKTDERDLNVSSSVGDERAGALESADREAKSGRSEDKSYPGVADAGTASGEAKYTNLKTLLPARKIIWKKLDKLGRRIEDDGAGR